MGGNRPGSGLLIFFLAVRSVFGARRCDLFLEAIAQRQELLFVDDMLTALLEVILGKVGFYN